MRFGVVGFEAEGLLILRHRFRQLTLVLEGIAQVVVRLGVVGFEAEGLLILGHRFRQLALVLQGIAQVVVRFGVVGFEAEGLLILGHRFRQLALILKGNAQVVVRLGVIGFEAEGLLILGHRFRQLTLALECNPQVAVKSRIGRPYPDRLTDVLDRQVILAHLTGNHPQQMQSISMVGVHLQNLPVNRLGLLQIARLVVLQCHSQSFGNSCHISKDEG